MGDQERRSDADARSEERSLIRPGGKVDEDALRAAAAIEDEQGEDEALRGVSFTLTRDLRKRLDQYLTDRVGFLSRAAAQRLIEQEMVTVNGRAPKASTKLRLGDVVDVVVPPPPSKEIKAERIPISVLYEDEHLIVLNKSPDIIVHPARSHLSGTLVNALAWHFQNASEAGGGLSGVGEEAARPGVVHRLDRQTSGVLVFAKDDETHWKIARQFEKRTVEKRYLAVVEGRPEPAADIIDLPIGPHPSNQKGLREKYVVRHDEWGKPSVTIYRVREWFEGYSLVEIELRTGRTHQIRVHMSHEGFPLVGDDMYGGRRLTYGDLDAIGEHGGSADLFTRQALHAALLAFEHPATGTRMSFTAPVPLDMARLIGILRTNRSGPGDPAPGVGALDLNEAVPPID